MRFCNVEAERGAIICAVTDDPRPVIELVSEDFCDPFFRKIFECCKYLYAENGSCTFVEVCDALRGQEEFEKNGGTPYFAEVLLPECGTYHVYPVCFKSLRQNHIRRIASEFDVTTQSAEEIIQQFIAEADKMQGLLQNSGSSWGQIIESIKHQNETKLKTGFYCLDSNLNLTGGQLVTIGARTGKGKSTLLLNIAINLLKQGKRILYCSFEMSPFETLERMKRICKVNAYDEFPFAEKDMVFSGESRQISNLESLVYKRGYDAIFVDYIQQMRTEKRETNKVYEIEDITARLKSIAMMERTIVFAAAQLSRDLDKNPRPPVLADLRGSGSIEQDSDVVLMLYRPEEEGAEKNVWETTSKLDGQSNTKVFISKNRSGATGAVHLNFIPSIPSYQE